MIRRRYGVFVSSTYEDLKAEREVLRKLLIRYGHFTAGHGGIRRWQPVAVGQDPRGDR
jgi:hypothetical protein